MEEGPKVICYHCNECGSDNCPTIKEQIHPYEMTNKEIDEFLNKLGDAIALDIDSMMLKDLMG